MSLQTNISTLLHRYLKIPYTLHTFEFQSPKRPRATYVFIHGIGNTLHSWDEVAARLPDDVRAIGIDLLGFGESPKPRWVVYDAKTQARSVGVTLVRLGIVRRVTMVGHSLGALVAVEVAKRYPSIPQRLVLCSPPFYKPPVDNKKVPSYDDMLRNLYTTAKKYPEQLERLSPVAVKLGLANKALNITKDNVAAYTAALESSVINQTSLRDVAQLRVPITIFYGTFDPVVVAKHIATLAKEISTVTAKRLSVGHEIIGSYVTSLATFLRSL